MITRSLHLLFIAYLISGTLYSMESTSSEEISVDLYADLYEEGQDNIIRFFSRRSNLSHGDLYTDQKELLALVLLDPEEKQDELPFEDFKRYYKGVQNGLKSIDRKEVLDEKLALVDPLIISCATILNAQSYNDLFLSLHTARWRPAISNLTELFNTMSVTPLKKPDEFQDLFYY